MKQTNTKPYRVLKKQFVNGAWHEPGAEVGLTEQEALFRLRSGSIEPVAAAKSVASSPKKQEAKAD
ncbi:hypothetical protein [Roseibium litorale]|uniref:Uncharacterized protein n=1 Tax=Roseibium litorale TaxID=2803841 RepID=A0ABR9CJ86_9HYPH|nr:hypothetical protein [Roseibium litorale]MBD8890899.1 hypothetical protein [Roseibium litorale]